METRKYILPCQRCADQAGDTCRTPKGKQAFESVRIEKLKKKTNSCKTSSSLCIREKNER